jgi:hypothetical protein
MSKSRPYILKINTLKDDWHDKDHVLLHAAFQLLTDFIEQEHPDRITDWNADKSSKQAWREITSLYNWWKKKRPAWESPLDNKQLRVPPFKFKKIPESNFYELVEPDHKKYAAYYRALKQDQRLEENWHAEDQRNLHRLIEVRDHLWT